MANNENLIPIPGRLHSVATEGHVAGADEIYDDSLQKDQATINQEVQEAIGTGGSVDTKIANAINALDSEKSQTAGSDGLALSVTEVDGKITSISGSIAPNTYDANGAASTAKTEVIGGATSSGNTLKKLEDRVSPLETAVGSGGSIDTRISNAVAAEATARENADTALGGRIDTLEDVVEDCAYIGEDDGTAVIADFDPQSDTVWKKAQILSAAEKAQIKANIGVDKDIENLQELYEALTQSDIEVVNSVPASGVANKIYRVVGESSYADYMFNSNALTTPIKMAEYDNAIDDELTAENDNLVKSGGIDKRLMSSKINGNGNSFVRSTHELIKGHTYKLTHLNYGWNTTAASSDVTLFSIESFHNNQGTDLYRIYKNTNSFIAREYQFTVPSDSDYILIGGRVDVGDSIFYQLEDITNIVSLKNNWGEVKIDDSELIVEPGTITSDGTVIDYDYAARSSVFINIKETNVVKSINFKITSLFSSLISEITDADTMGINVAYYDENKQFISRLTDTVRLSLSNPEGKYPLVDGTFYIKLLLYPLNGTTNINISSIDTSRKKVYEIITNGIDISYNNFYSIEKTEVSATIIENTNVDTSGTGQIDDSERYRYVYNNCIQKGDIINVKAKNGYKIGVLCFFGELNFDTAYNAWVGQRYSDTGWQQAASLKVMNDAVNSIAINIKRDDGAKITHYDVMENIEICVFRGGESKGTYIYSGKKIKIDTTPTFDGFNYMNISYSGGSGQGAAIYGDYFIQGGDGGHIRIFDLKEKTTVANDITLGSAGIGNHCNNISIGVERASDGVFPYIYISECNGNTRRCFVENLTLVDSTLVQTIVYSGTKYLNNTADHDWVVDRENELLYAVGNTKSAYNVSGNMIGITKFRLPKISEGSNVTLTDSDVLDYFELDGSIGKFYVYQGTLIYNGKLFFAIGGSATSHRFAVINLANHEVETIVELDGMYAAGEPEAINIYKNCIFISYPNQGKLYMLTFN